MTWFAFKDDGHVYELIGIAEKELVATFAHGYATEADALKHPNDPADPGQAALLASFLAARSIGQGGSSGVLTIDTVNAQGKSTGHVGPGKNPVTEALPQVKDPLIWLRDIGHWIGEFVEHVLDVHMWRSIGWITLGIVLMVLGIFLWLGKSGQVEPLPIPRPV